MHRISLEGYDRNKDALAARMKNPAGASIVSVVAPFEDPAPQEMKQGAFDAVTFFYAYHDITYLGVDRPKMLKAIEHAIELGPADREEVERAPQN